MSEACGASCTSCHLYVKFIFRGVPLSVQHWTSLHKIDSVSIRPRHARCQQASIDHLHNYGPRTRFGALPAGTDCDVCVSHLTFRFPSALELFWRYTTPPFLKYSFRRVMLQLEFRESKCKREGSHLEQSRRHRRCTRCVYAR